MKLIRTSRWRGLLVGAVLLAAGIAARAAGPLLVGGLPPFVEGKPFRFDPSTFPLTYWTDLGMLGNQTNAQANTLVAEAFQVWQAVPTASISFSAAGKLGADVATGAEYFAVELDINDCFNPVGPVAKERSIIYDVDGTIFRDLGEDETSVLGFAVAACLDSNGVDNFYRRGIAVLNGLWIDGEQDSPSNPEIPLDVFRTVFIHEFGHMIGLDHSQINVNCFTDLPGCAEGSPDSQGVPTMFPFLISLEMASLAPDDVAAISELYPEADFETTTGRIRGRILFSDGLTPAQGFNVIARSTTNPRSVAVSRVSGYLFTADAGNPLVQVSLPEYQTPSPFGSRNQTLIGFYEIPGLTPGDYTIEVEAINEEFVLGSAVGPIGAMGFQFPLPGPPEFWDLDESRDDDPVASSPVTVTAGATTLDIDIILNGTPSRFDAWEDE